MADIPRWRLQGDWFDTCSCSIPCPCTFAQPPTSDPCEGVLAWHIRTGNYGDVTVGDCTTQPSRLAVHIDNLIFGTANDLGRHT